MCVCTYVCMYVFVYVCMYVCRYVYLYMYMYMYLYVYVHMYMYIYICMYVYMHGCMLHARTSEHTHAWATFLFVVCAYTCMYMQGEATMRSSRVVISKTASRNYVHFRCCTPCTDIRQHVYAHGGQSL